MIICWDNLEKLKYNKKKNIWYRNYTQYIYMDSCKVCNRDYLTIKYKQSLFCSISCTNKGRKRSEDFKQNLRKLFKGKNHPMYGKNHTDKSKRKISEAKKEKYIKEIHPMWKGGVSKNNIPLYDTYASQIEYAEEIRHNKNDENILEVKCAYCGKWFIPKRTDLVRRIRGLNNKVSGENRLYCSSLCKQECPIYNQRKYPKGFKLSTSREVQPQLRQMVFERDDWTCQKCESKRSLHCHHIEGIRWEPLESTDIDKCITLCKLCHKEVHKIEGCKYNEMQCK